MNEDTTDKKSGGSEKLADCWVLNDAPQNKEFSGRKCGTEAQATDGAFEGMTGSTCKKW